MGKSVNQGEGNRASARRYNRKVHESVGTDDDTQELQGVDKAELERAEESGKARAKEFDPQVKRDYQRGRDGR